MIRRSLIIGSFVITAVGGGVMFPFLSSYSSSSTESVNEEPKAVTPQSTQPQKIENPRFLLGKSVDGTEWYVLANAFLRDDWKQQPKPIAFHQVNMWFGGTKLTKEHLFKSPDQRERKYYLVKLKGNSSYILEDGTEIKLQQHRSLDPKLKSGKYKNILIDNSTGWTGGSGGIGFTNIYISTCIFTPTATGNNLDDLRIQVRCANNQITRNRSGYSNQLWISKTLTKQDYKD